MVRPVFVTGGNRGIGLAICQALLKIPDAFVLLGSRSFSDIGTIRASLAAEAPDWEFRVAFITCDVADSDSVAAAAAAVGALLAAHQWTLHAVINNAGVAVWGDNISQPDAEHTINVNFRGAVRVIDAFMPLLRASARPRIVNVTSASGPTYVSKCTSTAVTALLTASNPSREALFAAADAFLATRAAAAAGGGSPDYDAAVRAAGYDSGVYGLSKALLNAFTRTTHNELGPRAVISAAAPTATTATTAPTAAAADADRWYVVVAACTPGYIHTGMTTPMLGGRTAAEAGMKPPAAGAVVPVALAMSRGDDVGGRYYGSDGKRSPLDRYRSPGDAEYVSEGE